MSFNHSSLYVASILLLLSTGSVALGAPNPSVCRRSAVIKQALEAQFGAPCDELTVTDLSRVKSLDIPGDYFDKSDLNGIVNLVKFQVNYPTNATGDTAHPFAPARIPSEIFASAKKLQSVKLFSPVTIESDVFADAPQLNDATIGLTHTANSHDPSQEIVNCSGYTFRGMRAQKVIHEIARFVSVDKSWCGLDESSVEDLSVSVKGSPLQIDTSLLPPRLVALTLAGDESSDGDEFSARSLLHVATSLPASLTSIRLFNFSLESAQFSKFSVLEHVMLGFPGIPSDALEGLNSPHLEVWFNPSS